MLRSGTTTGRSSFPCLIAAIKSDEIEPDEEELGVAWDNGGGGGGAGAVEEGGGGGGGAARDGRAGMGGALVEELNAELGAGGVAEEEDADDDE